MGAHSALLSDVEVGIEVDNSVGTGIQTLPGAGAFLRIDNDDAVIPLVDGTCLAGGDAWCFVAMLADVVHISDPDLGYGALNDIGDLHPELAGIRLRFGDGSPVIGNMLVFAGDLAVVAAVAFTDIDD